MERWMFSILCGVILSYWGIFSAFFGCLWTQQAFLINLNFISQGRFTQQFVTHILGALVLLNGQLVAAVERKVLHCPFGFQQMFTKRYDPLLHLEVCAFTCQPCLFSYLEWWTESRTSKQARQAQRPRKETLKDSQQTTEIGQLWGQRRMSKNWFCTWWGFFWINQHNSQWKNLPTLGSISTSCYGMDWYWKSGEH